MSDDLISRKSLIENLNKFAPEHYTALINDLITKEPESFDKEKVIEDLNDWMKDAEKWAAKYDEVGDTDNMDLQDMAARCYKNAIEIVEKGGIK